MDRNIENRQIKRTDKRETTTQSEREKEEKEAETDTTKGKRQTWRRRGRERHTKSGERERATQAETEKQRRRGIIIDKKTGAETHKVEKREEYRPGEGGRQTTGGREGYKKRDRDKQRQTRVGWVERQIRTD